MSYFRFSSPEAEQQYHARIAENAYWEMKAAEVRAAQKAEEKRDSNRRAEILAYALSPGSAEEIAMARATMTVPAPDADQRKAPSRFVWMPKGTHEICASTMAGSSWNGTVICDEAGANSVITSFAELTRAGWRSYIDFAHRDSEAAAWIHGFSWDPSRGIIVGVEWTKAGEAAVLDRVFMSFSPTFWVNRDTGRVSGLVPGHAAGGLVNSPAFGPAMPPILAGAARSSMAELVRETLVNSGRPQSTADTVARAIEAGRSGEDIQVLLEELP